MTTTRLRFVVASERLNGNHVSSREAPFFLRAWGTSRFSTPFPAHGPKDGP